ncbi:MAG: hypothetical protein R3253_17320 [Longimicrobiales bacterium]|nr:hypothetical protein [Longimicrobiales bacterium]
MQELFPEGYVFTWALYGQAHAQVAQQLEAGSPRRRGHIAEAARAVRRIESSEATSTFISGQRPVLGAFYASWHLATLAELVRASWPDEVDEEILSDLQAAADSFAAALDDAPSPFLTSYPGAAWPADVAVGIGALGIHDQLFEPRYRSTISAWVQEARRRLDEELGALSHGADPATGAPWGGVRGSSLALMSRMLVDADPEFAEEQYRVLREHFVDQRLGFPGVREYPRGTDGSGDVDSGPLLLGFSGPAVVVGVAAARAHGDLDLAVAVQQAIEVVGLPVQLSHARRYGGGLVPVGDAFIAWAWSTPVRRTDVAWSMPVPTRWAIPLHLASAVLIGLLLVRVGFLLGWWTAPQLFRTRQEALVTRQEHS